jgi:hypothetical protein
VPKTFHFSKLNKTYVSFTQKFGDYTYPFDMPVLSAHVACAQKLDDNLICYYCNLRTQWRNTAPNKEGQFFFFLVLRRAMADLLALDRFVFGPP